MEVHVNGHPGEELRFRLACELVQKARAAGQVVVIVDGSPNPGNIRARLSELGALVFPQLHQGIGPSRREAFFHATEVARAKGADIVLWTEPEKVDLIRSVPQIVAPIEQGEADIVIPRRSAASWETWPSFQRETEEEANRRYNEIVGTDDHDPMFGPVAFTVNYADYFVLSDRVPEVPDTYIQHYAPIIAASDAAAVVKSVEVDMTYPPEQRAEEEGSLSDEMKKKRLWQRDTLVAAYEKVFQFSRAFA